MNVLDVRLVTATICRRNHKLGPIWIRVILATIIFYLAIQLSEHVGTVGGGQRSNVLANPNAWLSSFFFVNMNNTNDNQLNDKELNDKELNDKEEDLVIQATALAAISASLTVADHSQTYYDKIPYHDFTLTGAAWVCKLLTGHPKCIRKELGVNKHVFQSLIIALQNAGHTPSKFVSLEEQLAIFLYTCVTGLSLPYVCECFQQATETASKYVYFYFFFVIIADPVCYRYFHNMLIFFS